MAPGLRRTVTTRLLADAPGNAKAAFGPAAAEWSRAAAPCSPIGSSHPAANRQHESWVSTSVRTPLIPLPIRQALFHELHRSIEEAARDCVARILSAEDSSLTYPPGGELTEADRAALRKLTVPPDARAALEKLAADACSHPVFHLFAVMDGVADPETDVGEWPGVTLETKREGEDDMLHDEFFESYWAYEEGR
jgi:hypothetical protein